DAATFDERERRGRSEVDGQVVGKHSVDPIEEHGVPIAEAARRTQRRRNRSGALGRTNPKSQAELSRKNAWVQDNLDRGRWGFSRGPRPCGRRRVGLERSRPMLENLRRQGASIFVYLIFCL